MHTKPLVVGLSAVTLTVALAGCGATKTETKPETAGATTSVAAEASSSALAVPDLPAGPNTTIADYVAENKIIESAVQQGDPDAPTFYFPIPPDWTPAGARKP